MLCLKLLICSGDISILNGILSIPSGNSGFVSAKTSLVHECNFTDKCTPKPSSLSGSAFGGYGSICKHEFESRTNISNAVESNTFHTQTIHLGQRCLDEKMGNRVTKALILKTSLLSFEKHEQ